MVTFDKKTLANLRGKAITAVLVVFGLASCNTNNNTQNDCDAEKWEMVINKMDSLYRANATLNAELQQTKKASKKSKSKSTAPKASTKSNAEQQVVVAPVAPVAQDTAAIREVVRISAESKPTFKVIAGDSVKIGRLCAHGNADGEVSIEITGGAQIDELDMSDYRTEMPAPVVQQVVQCPAHQAAKTAQPVQTPRKYVIQVEKIATVVQRTR